MNSVNRPLPLTADTQSSLFHSKTVELSERRQSFCALIPAQQSSVSRQTSVWRTNSQVNSPTDNAND